MKILIPPLALQNEFAKKVEAIEEITKQIESSLQKMEKLYNSLLQKAFTGDLTESWRKRNPDVVSHHRQFRRKSNAAVFGESVYGGDDVGDGHIPPTQSFHRAWIKTELSNEQKLILDRWSALENSIIIPKTGSFNDFIEKIIYEEKNLSTKEKKEIVLRILNQLVGFGFAEKISVQTSEFGYITGYRCLSEKTDPSRTKLDDLVIIKNKKKE